MARFRASASGRRSTCASFKLECRSEFADLPCRLRLHSLAPFRCREGAFLLVALSVAASGAGAAIPCAVLRLRLLHLLLQLGAQEEASGRALGPAEAERLAEPPLRIE